MEFTKVLHPNLFLLFLTYTKYPPKNIFPWMVDTDKDFLEASILMKYSAKNQTTRGFLQLMYKNKTSLGNLVTLLKPKLDNLHAVVGVQKKHHDQQKKKTGKRTTQFL